MIDGLKTLKRQLSPLLLPPKLRRKLLRGAVTDVKKSAQKNIQNQRDLQGRKWAPRKNKARRKMLRGLKKLMVVKGDSKQAFVTFRSDLAGRIARRQQEGISETMTAARMKRIHGEPDNDTAATRAQARALREVGYKIRRPKGKRYRRPTVKWITENLTQGQAGIILRLMRDQEPKRSWTIPLAARSFLGATRKEVDELLDQVADTLTQSMKRA